jgi:hypothetical protein
MILIKYSLNKNHYIIFKTLSYAICNNHKHLWLSRSLWYCRVSQKSIFFSYHIKCCRGYSTSTLMSSGSWRKAAHQFLKLSIIFHILLVFAFPLMYKMKVPIRRTEQKLLLSHKFLFLMDYSSERKSCFLFVFILILVLGNHLICASLHKRMVFISSTEVFWEISFDKLYAIRIQLLQNNFICLFKIRTRLEFTVLNLFWRTIIIEVTTEFPFY